MEWLRGFQVKGMGITETSQCEVQTIVTRDNTNPTPEIKKTGVSSRAMTVHSQSKGDRPFQGQFKTLISGFFLFSLASTKIIVLALLAIIVLRPIISSEKAQPSVTMDDEPPTFGRKVVTADEEAILQEFVQQALHALPPQRDAHWKARDSLLGELFRIRASERPCR
jgi:hypothetical protein